MTKKKNISLVVLFIALLSAINSFGQDGLRPRGDVNCDWNLNVADVTKLIDMVLNSEAYHSLYTYAADINNDKVINVLDVVVLIDGVLNNGLSPMPTFSGTLPVLYINTEGHQDIVSKEEYLQADWWLDAMGIEGYESIGTAANPLGTQIKGRGNATWTNRDKKPYRLKLDTKQAMLGMPANRHWVLLANTDYWMGQMNDVLPFEIGRRMGMAWNPRIEPVEVVLNGQYIGMYFLAEQIRVGKNRVNIIEQDDGETNPQKITGGWLVEIDNYDEPGQIYVYDYAGRKMKITPKSPEVLSDEQRDYITTLLNMVNEAIYVEDKEDRTWEQYIDIDSLAIFYIVQEAIDNPEAFSGSCFMHKERGEGTKLIFGPMWDCGSSFYRYNKNYLFNDFIYENMPSYCTAHWIAEIAKYPHFQALVRYHWQRFYNEVYPQMDDYIDAFAAKIEQAGEADFKRWPGSKSNNIIYRVNHYLKPCFHKKVTWLNSQWGIDD